MKIIFILLISFYCITSEAQSTNKQHPEHFIGGLVIGGVTYAQVRQQIDNYPIKFGTSPDIGYMPFIGSFEFDNLPNPLEPSRINFTLEVTDTHNPHADEDWRLRLHHLDNVVHVTSDTLFYWPGPHKPGDIFTGTFEFIPLMAGKWGMVLYINKVGDKTFGASLESGISFDWCLDRDGQLLYLDKILQKRPEACTAERSFFFDNDSIIIKQFPEHRQSYTFEYRIVISPLPRIGDTATIHYYLKANDDIMEGCRVSIDGQNVEDIIMPERMDFSIEKGREMVYRIKFIPKAVRGEENCITVGLRGLASKSNDYLGNSIRCSFIFNEDGTLRYVNDFGFHFNSKDIYPKSFPTGSPGGYDVSIIWDNNKKRFYKQ